MKKLVVFASLAVMIYGFTMARLLDGGIKSILDQIKLSENDARGFIFDNCSGPYFYFPNPGKLKGLSGTERKTTVEEVAKYVKEYTTSKDFISRYNEYREGLKPTPPEKPQSMEELKNEQREQFKQSIQDMEDAKKDASADMKAMYDENINMMKEQLKEIDNPDNPMYSQEMEGFMQQGYQQEMEGYKNEVAEWEIKYPEGNPSLMIKEWLTEFLDKSKDVDFNAQTALNEYGQTVFVKQSYESKDNLWKLCFRTGSEATNTARSFAQSWLSELK